MLNVVIPMAGRGSRFADAGFVHPKPLIEVNGKPMIQVVVDNIGLEAKYIFLVLKEHLNFYALKYLLKLICKDNPCEIVVVDHVTEGAACTVLLAKDHIDNDDELILANADQWIDWDSKHFFDFMNRKKADAGIVTFYGYDRKWSFAKVTEEGLVTEVAEKNPISTAASTGLYYYKHGKDFVRGAQQMISKNIRTNNEFYVCPVFNELILDHKKIYNYPIAEMCGLGTPEDLEKYLCR